MFKFVFAFFITIFFSACGVDTASSVKEPIVIVPDEPEVVIPTDADLVVFDSIDSNPVVTITDDNITQDPNSGDEPIDPVPTVNPSTSEFDTVDAIADPNACNVNYSIVSDASYSGDREWENGSASAIADGKGLVIRSEYLSQNYEDTKVQLFYRKAPSTLDLNIQGVASYKMDSVFYISYDLAWADESIPDIDNIVYVRSEKTLKPSCYRLTLNSIDGNEIDVQKVYRTLL